MKTDNHPSFRIRLRNQLHTNHLFKTAEIVLVFSSAFALIGLLNPLVSNQPVLKQMVVWLANILMLLIVWAGLRLRGEHWKDFGLATTLSSPKAGLMVFLRSLLVLILAMAAFLIGSVVMANITGVPELADMSGYDYLRGNIGMLLLTLAGVYIVSSFGEEVIYRAFLIKRISELGSGTKKGTTIAIILSSVIFGLVHYEWGPMGIVQTGLMGLALGICYIKFKKNLWILILAHAYMDTLLIVQMYLASN